jgi:hypothetical protein
VRISSKAWLATLAILIWHSYWVIFNPDVYPMNWSWLTGVISEDTLRHDHPGEYERLLAEGQIAPAQIEAPPPVESAELQRPDPQDKSSE